MNDSKRIFYDWNGGNVWLFKQINTVQGGDTYDKVMMLISRIADYHNFPYYIALLTTCVLLNLMIRKIRGRGGDKQYLSRWFGIFLVLIIGFSAEALIIKSLKVHFAYPRPYIVLSTNEVVLRDRADVMAHRNADDSNHSFPSGHTAFVTLLVMSLWPALPRVARWLGLLSIVAVMWSRLSLGMHFPADVLSACAIMVMVVIIVRAITYRILRTWFRLNC